jgi:hypothetical protein
MEEILTELRNIKLKFAQLTEEADSIIHKVKLYQESIPMDAVVMPNEVLDGELERLDYLIEKNKTCITCRYATTFERPVVVCMKDNRTFSANSICEKYKPA